MTYLAAIIVSLASLVGILLTLATLPGTWFMLAAAAGCWIWRPDLYAWPTMATALGLALLAEVIEIAASAAGASRAGASKRGAAGSIVGALVGAIAGSFILPIVGTIVGGVIGAGVGALVIEKGAVGKSWRDSARAGTGAAAGRLAATVIKGAFACVISAILIVGAIVN